MTLVSNDRSTNAALTNFAAQSFRTGLWGGMVKDIQFRLEARGTAMSVEPRKGNSGQRNTITTPDMTDIGSNRDLVATLECPSSLTSNASTPAACRATDRGAREEIPG